MHELRRVYELIDLSLEHRAWWLVARAYMNIGMGLTLDTGSTNFGTGSPWRKFNRTAFGSWTLPGIFFVFLSLVRMLGSWKKSSFYLSTSISTAKNCANKHFVRAWYTPTCPTGNPPTLLAHLSQRVYTYEAKFGSRVCPLLGSWSSCDSTYSKSITREVFSIGHVTPSVLYWSCDSP